MSIHVSPLATRYAKAILAHAITLGQQAALAVALPPLLNVLSTDAALARKLSNLPGGKAGRALFAAQLTHALNLPTSLNDGIKLLSINNRLDVLAQVLSALQQGLDEATGTVRVVAESASPLTDSQHAALEKTVAKHIKAKHILIENSINASLIAGFRAFFAGRVIDTSVSSKLARLIRHFQIINS